MLMRDGTVAAVDLLGKTNSQLYKGRSQMNLVKRLILRAKEERGQGMAEYAMILALVAVVAVAALTPLGTGIKTTLQSVTSSL